MTEQQPHDILAIDEVRGDVVGLVENGLGVRRPRADPQVCVPVTGLCGDPLPVDRYNGAARRGYVQQCVRHAGGCVQIETAADLALRLTTDPVRPTPILLGERTYSECCSRTALVARADGWCPVYGDLVESVRGQGRVASDPMSLARLDSPGNPHRRAVGAEHMNHDDVAFLSNAAPQGTVAGELPREAR